MIHEIAAIHLNEPTRMAEAGFKANEDFRAFLFKLGAFIEERKADGSFNNAVSTEHVMFIIVAVVAGISNAITFPNSANPQMELLGLTGKEYKTAEGMMGVLAETIIQIMSIKPVTNYEE